MFKYENPNTGKVNYTFSGEEVHKYKLWSMIGGAALCVALAAAGFSLWSMENLKAENELYRNQLKLAEQKMEALESKTETVEKISSQLQELVQMGSGVVVQNGSDETSAGGTGGASTVPDKARTTAVKTEAKTSGTPAALLKEIRQSRRTSRQADPPLRAATAKCT